MLGSFENNNKLLIVDEVFQHVDDVLHFGHAPQEENFERDLAIRLERRTACEGLASACGTYRVDFAHALPWDDFERHRHAVFLAYTRVHFSETA